MAAKYTLCIGQKVSVLQDPDEATVYHALHGLAHTSQADGPVATIEGRSFPGLGIGITTAFIQATGTEPSAHIRLYTDSRTSLSAGGS